MPRISRIKLVGPIADPEQPAVGGYESANLRMLAALREISFNVQPCPYPRTSGSRLKKALQYAWGFGRLFQRLISESGRNSAVHMTPLCRHFLAAELVLALAARARGNRLIVDLRSGMQESWYLQSSPLHRMLLRGLLRLATAISYEGQEYGPWLTRLAPRTPRHLLPNFVPASMLRMRPRSALPAAPKLIYVGALSEAKGVEAALRVFHRAKQQLPGATFVLVGRCDPAYLQALEGMGLLGEGVTFTGPLPPQTVERHLDECHFFIFLSRWFGEGHSNALTEAMARGCVPIVASHGFSPSVVACQDLVMSDGDQIDDIASRIEMIWRGARQNELSEAMVRRVARNFTDLQAVRILRDLYPEAM